MIEAQSLKHTRRLIIIALAVWMAFSSLPLALAQSVSDQEPAAESDEANLEYEDGDSADPGAYTQAYLEERDGRQLITSDADKLSLYIEEGRLELPPQETNKLRDYQVDVRVTDYLLNLVTPVEMGGAGFDNIKAKRIFKNYPEKGIGRLDRETLDALKEENGTLSTHTDGKAVDIAEAGSITCKLVEKRNLGGNKTRWQPPQPVKIAWQSRDGISRYPTPSGASLVGMAGEMSADSIVRYLNESGEMDASLDFVRGLDLETIAAYVGANVFLKNYTNGPLKDDPLAASLIEALGANTLKKQIPGLPEGFVAGSSDKNILQALALARVEQSLNLPAGSLRQPGWDGVLLNSGKRAIEQAMGLPALYLETNSLEQLNTKDVATAVLNYAKRQDDSLNFMAGTVEKIIAKDNQGLKMAGVAILSSALKLTPEQRQALEEAVKNKTAPNLDPAAWPIGNNIIDLDTIANFFAADATAQRQAEESLRQTGLSLLREAVKKATPSRYSGVTEELLNQILASKNGLKLEEVLKRVGVTQLLSESGVDPERIQQFINNPARSSSAAAVAESLNQSLSLSGSSRITSADLQSMLERGNLTAAKKIGASQIDRAIGWNVGTALQVIDKEKKFPDAMEEVFTNAVGDILGLEKGTFSIKDKDSRRLIAAAYIEKRFGLTPGALKGKTTPRDIIAAIGSAKSIELFGSDITKPGGIDRPTTVTRLEEYDQRFGLTVGTLRRYFKEEINESELLKQIVDSQVGQITAEKLWDYFDLDTQFRIAGAEVTNIITVLKGGEQVTLEQQNAALQSIYTLIGRSIDSRTGFVLDGFKSYFMAEDDKARSKILLDQGVKLFAKALGVNIGNLSAEQLEAIGGQIINVFNTGTSELAAQVKEYSALEAKIKSGTATAADRARYAQLNDNKGLTILVRQFGGLTNFLLRATGIPEQFKGDAEVFLAGDFRYGLAAASFAIWEKSVNPYLPEGAKLTYAELRETLIFDDQAKIDARIDAIVKKDNPNATATAEQKAALTDLARRQLMDEAKKNAEYKISDSFLRKADPTIPAGFSRVMFEGNDKERVATLEKWAFNHIDQALKSADPSYVPGTLEALYKGDADQRQAIIIQNIAKRAGITLGPLGADDIFNYVTYLSSPLQQRENFFLDEKYASMWTSVDAWLSNSLGLGELPTGLGKSLYLASQYNWDFNKEIKDAQGNILVSSVNSLGEQFLTAKLSNWGDKQFNLPPGTVFRTYQAVQAVVGASRALELAKTSGVVKDYFAAKSSLSQAQASLTVVAITTALSLCTACQELFGAVDRAIAAPPGFTNAAVAGAVAMAFGLGPAGLYVAAAIYLFGVYKVEYLCPMPPKDPYAVAGFDKNYDQLDYGYIYDPTRPVKTNPKPGENPFDWDENVAFDDGNNPELWMGWARYFTGQLLDSSLAYAQAQPLKDKPRQIMTLRQANIEFFAARVEAAFGSYEKDNPRVGLGYTQDSTKTTDWIHVSFGGLL